MFIHNNVFNCVQYRCWTGKTKMKYALIGSLELELESFVSCYIFRSSAEVISSRCCCSVIPSCLWLRDGTRPRFTRPFEKRASVLVHRGNWVSIPKQYNSATGFKTHPPIGLHWCRRCTEICDPSETVTAWLFAVVSCLKVNEIYLGKCSLKCF